MGARKKLFPFCLLLTGCLGVGAVGCGPAGSTMEFRALPLLTPPPGAKAMLGDAEIEAYRKELAAHGPDFARRQGNPFAWFPSRSLTGKKGIIYIAQEFQDQWYVLAANDKERIMLPVENGRRQWGLIWCYGLDFDDGCSRSNGFRLELDYPGAHRLYRLRKTISPHPLAALIDGRFQFLVLPGTRVIWPEPPLPGIYFAEGLMVDESRPIEEVADALAKGLPPVVSWPEVTVMLAGSGGKLALSIDHIPDGPRYELDGQAVELADLPQALARARTAHRNEALLIRPAPGAQWQTVFRAALRAKTSGFDRICLSVSGAHLEEPVIQRSRYRESERILFTIDAYKAEPPSDSDLPEVIVPDAVYPDGAVPPATAPADPLPPWEYWALDWRLGIVRPERFSPHEWDSAAAKIRRHLDLSPKGSVIELRAHPFLPYAEVERALQVFHEAGGNVVILKQQWVDE